VLSGGPSGSHKIERTGIGFAPPRWDAQEVDAILRVSTEDAKAMARRLAHEEGIFAGTSSGANVVAALRVAERLETGATVVTIMCDAAVRPQHRRVPRPSRLSAPRRCAPRTERPAPPERDMTGSCGTRQ
jgi:cysteine synthase A